ncbi:class I SAM-dependent methyltransferase [Nocardia coubleae]|uniref:Class I SAM-dependent methyltransferase n=1 Tax=Nocardia coubleae TaxID=356147 RepID=A0A846W323_9NOCA|nr:class I SAM-dependent methyltransferase [Nocardia coubleae]NKX87561.1 class I SAM-dependent methyltransferase [Nocardia coubleae]
MAGTRPATPQAMFTRIAPRYDAVNSLLTLGGDKRLRRRAVRALDLRPGAEVLDIAAGTAEIGAALAAVYPLRLSYVAVDLNEQMLAVAERKFARLRRKRPSNDWQLALGSAESLDFPSSSFDAAVMCFALDDMDDPAAALAETVRVLRADGRFLLIELAMPDSPLLRNLLKLRLRLIRGVAAIAGMDSVAHMTREVELDRGVEHTLARCENAGLELESTARHLGGLVRAHVFRKRKGL